MEQTNMVMAMFQTMAAQGMTPKTGKTGEKASDEFQKLLDKKSQAQSPKSDAPAGEKPKAETPSDQKKEGPVEEDPVESSKKLQVYLTPVDPSVLAQYPPEWLPQNLEEGEAVVCVGVRTGLNGEQIPVLIGAREAAQRYGREDIVYDASDPEADAMLEATDPTVDHSPAQLLEKAVDEQAGKVVKEAVEEAKPREKDDDQVDVIDVEQGPQKLFHDVKAAPVKVGEAHDVQQAGEPDVAGQIDAQLARALQAGDTTVRIQLTPENLGQVTVEITQSADGALRVALTAHNADTRGLLERHASTLQGMLASRAQQSVQVSVQRQQDQNQQHQRNDHGHNGHAQDGQERRQQRQHTTPEDFMQQLRLGLIPSDEEF